MEKRKMNLKRCSYCGKDLRKWNVDPLSTLVCDDCTRKLVGRVKFLEKETGIDIVDTTHFYLAVEAYGEKRRRNLSQDLKKVRNERGWSLRRLADHLGIHHSYVSLMENGRKPLSEKALAFMEEELSQNNLGL